jgi:pyruvate-formate lyase-activating enzyme
VAGFEHPNLVISDASGKVFSHPHLKMAGRSGNSFALPDRTELVPLPRGSQLFTLPGRSPIGWDEENQRFTSADRVKSNGEVMDCTAVAAFLPPGYVRTLLPAARRRPESPVLPLWAYSSVGWRAGRFWVTGLLVDPNPHWNPKFFQDDRDLQKRVRALLREKNRNRLLRQLSRCALEYHCFAAKNVFYRRWECPLPTSPVCNADCLGCISLQSSECCPASQERIGFIPTTEEVVGVALPHLERARDAIVSFGQGCEGEPILQWRLLEESIRRLRERTDRGTINLNTNGSLPEKLTRLCQAGLDSVRVTLNSSRPGWFDRYHRPRGFSMREAVASLMRAKEEGIYTSINLLVFPGVTDRGSEVKALMKLIRLTHLDLIQMRNLNIDPDLYLQAMGRGQGMGIAKMIRLLKEEFPTLQFGYFNRTKERFHAHG